MIRLIKHAFFFIFLFCSFSTYANNDDLNSKFIEYLSKSTLDQRHGIKPGSEETSSSIVKKSGEENIETVEKALTRFFEYNNCFDSSAKKKLIKRLKKEKGSFLPSDLKAALLQENSFDKDAYPSGEIFLSEFMHQYYPVSDNNVIGDLETLSRPASFRTLSPTQFITSGGQLSFSLDCSGILTSLNSAGFGFSSSTIEAAAEGLISRKDNYFILRAEIYSILNVALRSYDVTLQALESLGSINRDDIIYFTLLNMERRNINKISFPKKFNVLYTAVSTSSQIQGDISSEIRASGGLFFGSASTNTSSELSITRKFSFSSPRVWVIDKLSDDTQVVVSSEEVRKQLKNSVNNFSIVSTDRDTTALYYDVRIPRGICSTENWAIQVDYLKEEEATKRTYRVAGTKNFSTNSSLCKLQFSIDDTLNQIIKNSASTSAHIISEGWLSKAVEVDMIKLPVNISTF